MNTRTDTFYRHLREWFTVFLPRQRAVSPHTITACRQTWNLLLGYVDDTRGIRLDIWPTSPACRRRRVRTTRLCAI